MTHFVEPEKAKKRGKPAAPFTVDFLEPSKAANAHTNGMMEFIIHMPPKQFSEQEIKARNRRFEDTFKNAKPSKASGATAALRKLRDGEYR